MKTLVVGQAPGRDGRSFMTGDSGRRLARAAGIEHDDLLRLTHRVNLNEEFGGRARDDKGDVFDVREARVEAECVRLQLVLPGRVVLLMGKAVARAFSCDGVEYFEWFDMDGGRAAVVPHPSGVNRWWNEERNRQKARRFLRRAIRRA